MNDGRISVFVTGGTSGVGLALVEAMLERRWLVHACGREGERLRLARQQFPQAEWWALDLADPGAVAAWAASLRSKAALTGLINNAGVQHNVLLSEQDPVSIDTEVRTNLTGPAILASILAPQLPDRRGFVVNVSSGLAIAPKANAAVYCATKAALRNFSVGLQNQLARRGVVVVDAVLPLVDTPMTVGRGAGKMPASVAAASILRAIDRRARVALIGKTALLAAVNRISPGIANRIMRGA